MIKKLLTILLLFLSNSILGQNTIGIPNIINYSRQSYGAGSQNWGIVQDRNGIMYIANNQGLLTFDGSYWRKYPLPNQTIVRSVALGEKNRIYVGGQSEFGYFSPAANGELVYTSLMDLLPEQESVFTDIWNIGLYKGRVFFRSYKKILEYDQKKIIVHNDVHWNFLGVHRSGLLAFEYEKGLVTYKGGKWQPAYRAGRLPRDINFRTVLDLGNDSLLLVSLLHGFYLLRHDTITPFRSPYLSSVANQTLYGAVLLDPDRIALISNLAGCMIIDRKGNFIQRYTKKEGIQQNNVLSLFLDKDKNLWLGLDNGIDLITYSNSIKNIFPEPDDRNAGYASFNHNNQLYLGVTSGAYKVNLGQEKDLSYTKGVFIPVQHSKGQVWGFSEVNGQLLMGHHTGAFWIKGDKAIPFDVKTGFWSFQPLSTDTPSRVIVAGTYNGINFYHYDNGFISNPTVRAQFESARFIVPNKDIIWIAHPVKSLYKVQYHNKQPVVRMYEDKNGILSKNHNKIFRIDDKLILSTDKGVFEFNDLKDDFIASPYFSKFFENYPPGYLKEDKYGNIWFIRDRKVGVLDRSSAKIEQIFIPELNERITDVFEEITIVDSNNVLITAEKGFFHINYAQYKKHKQPPQVFIRKVSSPLRAQEIIYGGHGAPNGNISIEYQHNALSFEYASTLYGQESNTSYSYYLEGFDPGWSKWEKRRDRGYTNLPAGSYIFRVKCRNNFNSESPMASFAFTILTPWYQTWWAYSIYGISFFSMWFLFYKGQQRRYKIQQRKKLAAQQQKWEAEQRQLQMQYLIEIGENEKKIIQLKNEKLLAEVEHKNSELASTAMNMVRNMEMLSKLKEALLQLKVSGGLDKTSKEKELHKIIRALDMELDTAGEWEQFAKHFDSVHTNYLKKLKEFCPDISSSELKLAAYLRLNLSSKEISQLMNISIRSVETSRYRLRKKLGLTNEDTNLYDFLLTIN
jgi:ligand-binding sensor domain-containing protein